MSEGTSASPGAQPAGSDSACTGLRAVQERLAQALESAGRAPHAARLVAVSKTAPAQPPAGTEAAWPRMASIREVYDCGQAVFGESYVQEALAKQDALADLPIEWHFIGPLQSNKTRPVAERFAWVHGIDRLRIAERLAAQRPQDLPPLNVCIQVNIDREPTKSGVPPEEVSPLAHAVARLPSLRLRGLMAIPAPADDPEAQRDSFRRLRELFERLQAEGLPLDTLSMGMSDDLEAAVLEGATLVRVGTAIFGARQR